MSAATELHVSRGRRVGNWREVSANYEELDGVALAMDHLMETTEDR
jgi:hypothetical protein